jgi:YtxH-like protein
MTDTYRSPTAGYILAFLAGAVSGAVVALLTAPRSGSETRARLKHIARGAAGRAVRVPPVLNDAYTRAAEAARRAFVEAFEARGPETGASQDRGGH